MRKRSRDIFPHEQRSEEHRQADVLENLLALLHRDYNIERIEREELHRIWPYYLRFLKMRGLEIEGFFRDIVSGRYRALDQAIFKLLTFGFIHYRMPDTVDRIHFNFYPRLIHQIREGAEPREWEVAEEALPFIARLLGDKHIKWSVEEDEEGEEVKVPFEEFVRQTLTPA